MMKCKKIKIIKFVYNGKIITINKTKILFNKNQITLKHILTILQVFSLSLQFEHQSLMLPQRQNLHFNVMHENIHMRKIMKPSQNENKSLQNSVSQSHNQNNQNKLYYSVVEKESQSGISFNSRLFFLKDDDSFGYMSKADLSFDVQTAKDVIPLKSLRKVQPKGKLLTLQFEVRPKNTKQNDKIIDKKWVLRMKDKKMADAWTDIINYQLSQIPSRKSTIQKQQNIDEAENNQNKNKFQQPIANQRPEQDYISIQKYDQQSNQNQKFDKPQQWKSTNEMGESPIRQQRSYEEDNQKEFSPQNFQIQINSRAESKFYGSTNSPQNTNFILQTPNSNEREVYEEKSFYQQIQENFCIKNKKLKQMLYLPTFINFFRPYIDQGNKSKTYLLEIDKKYEDFITFCEITSKQLIDFEEIPLNEFKLSNRFTSQKGAQSKQKKFKQMVEIYQKVFKKPLPKSMDIESILLLFQNILYVQLEDVQITVPLMQLKTLPNPENKPFTQNSGSGNRICQTSLIAEFQSREKNLSYIYERVVNDVLLRDNFLIPMTCQIQYKGFNLFFQSKINESLFKLNPLLNSNLKPQSSTQEKQDFYSQSSQALYKKLGQTLRVNPDVFQHESIFKVLPFKFKTSNVSSLEQLSRKYIIIFSDILPYLSSQEVLDGNIFIRIHDPQFLKNRQKQGIVEQKSVSENLSRFKVTQRFSLLNSDTKSVSRFNKTTLTSVPLYNHLVSAKQNDLQLRHYKEQINISIKDVAEKFDKFEISVIHPTEIYEILKSHNLSHANLGRILQQISAKNSFARSIIKSEIASECTKLILFKKCQEIILSQVSPDESMNKRQDNLLKTLTTLLNLILGKFATKQTEMVWKVLTLHAQIIYGISIFQKDIHKGYFILALVSKFNMIVNPSTNSISEIFNNEKFFLAIKFQTCRAKPVEILSPFLLLVSQSNIKELTEKSDFLTQSLIDHLGLSSNSIPYFVKRNKSLHCKILSLLTQKMSPTNLNFNKLNIYENKSLNFTQIQGLFSLIQDKIFNQSASSLIKEKQLSLKRQSWEDNFIMYLKRKLKEIQHKIKEKSTFNFAKEIESYIKEIKIFYEYHPFISELLEFFSDYYISKNQCQNGLECLKVSLANMVAICQGNTNHSSLAKCFLKMGMTYEKMRRYQQAVNQFKRAKHSLQFTKQGNTQLYVQALVKMAQISLQIDGNISEALSYAIEAQKNIQSIEMNQQKTFLMIEAYEIQARCLNIENIDSISVPKTFNIESRPQNYFDFLERVLIHEKNSKSLQKSSQFINIEIFQRLLKLVLPFYIRQLDDKAAKMMMTYMCEVSENISKKGGVDFSPLQTNQDYNQDNESQQILFYPTLRSNNKNLQQPLQKSKLVYNIYEASTYIKRQIYKGSFIIQLIEYIDKAEEIFSIIEKQVKMNVMNKTLDNEVFSTNSERKRKSQRNLNGVLDDSDSFGLQKLLDFSKEGSSITDKNVGYSNREHKFDSLIRALLVLLGDGFMLHIFEE